MVRSRTHRVAGIQGGTNWPGGSYDPETHTVYVFSQSAIALLGLVPSPDHKYPT